MKYVNSTVWYSQYTLNVVWLMTHMVIQFDRNRYIFYLFHKFLWGKYVIVFSGLTFSNRFTRLISFRITDLFYSLHHTEVERECIYSLKPNVAYMRQWTRPFIGSNNGPLTRCVKLQVVHAPGMPGTFSPPPRVSDPGMNHGTCVTHVPWCMPGSLTRGFLWSRW